MSSSSRVGVFGTSGITDRHIRTLLAQPGVELIGICGSYLPALAALASRYAIAPTTKPAQLIGQKLDIAVVTNKTEAHAHLLAQLIPAVGTIIVEKPLCATAAEADTLLRLSREHQCQILVVSQMRFDARFRELAALTAASKGRLCARIDVRKNRSQAYYGVGASVSKSVLLAQFPHYLDLALELFGDDLEVTSAMAANVLEYSDFPDKVAAYLESDRVSLDLSVSYCMPANWKVEIDVYGSGHLLKSRDFCLIEDSRSSAADNARRALAAAPIDNDAAFAAMYEHFLCGEPDGGRELNRAVAVMRLIDAIATRSDYFSGVDAEDLAALG